MATRATDYKIALKDLCDTLLSPEGVQVSWGMPTSGEPERRWCMVGETTWESSEWVTNRSRDETFSIKIVISVVIVGGLPDEVEETCYGYGGLIEDAVQNDPTLSVPGIIHAGVEPREMNSWPVTDGFEAQYELAVTVGARVGRT